MQCGHSEPNISQNVEEDVKASVDSSGFAKIATNGGSKIGIYSACVEEIGRTIYQNA